MERKRKAAKAFSKNMTDLFVKGWSFISLAHCCWLRNT